MSEGSPEAASPGTGTGGTESQAGEPPESGDAGAQPRTGRGRGTGEGQSQAGTADDDAEAQSLLDGMVADSDQPEVLKQQIEHWKQMARKHEGRAKENATAAAKLKKIEDANKTELERALEAQKAAEEERDKAWGQHHRVMADATHDLPVELIDLLGSGTEEQISERAQVFAQAIDARAQQIAEKMVADQNGGGWQPGTGSVRPVESMRPGSAPAQGGTPQTPDEWFRAVVNQRE